MFLTDEERAYERGREGEDAVGLELMQLPENDYAVLHNLLLPIGRGYTQIDHIVFSRKGVWVLETKTVGGNIYCKAGDRTWTQVMRNGHKTVFQNPIRQNYKHVLAVQRITRLPRGAIYDIIVFAGAAIFRTPRPEQVVMCDELLDEIFSRRDDSLSVMQIKRAIAAIYYADKQNNEEAVNRHLTDVRQRKERNEQRRARRLAAREMRTQYAEGSSSAYNGKGCFWIIIAALIFLFLFIR